MGSLQIFEGKVFEETTYTETIGHYKDIFYLHHPFLSAAYFLLVELLKCFMAYRIRRFFADWELEKEKRKTLTDPWL